MDYLLLSDRRSFKVILKSFGATLFFNNGKESTVLAKPFVLFGVTGGMTNTTDPSESQN